MEIWSHRGRICRSDPGNNLNSFSKLENHSIVGIETDIAFNDRGEIMVFHPGINEPVLNFNSLLNHIDSSNKNWLLDLKPEPKLPTQNSKTLVRNVVSLIIARNLQNKIYLTAFQKKINVFGTESDGNLLILAKKLHPEIKTHLIIMWPGNLDKIIRKYDPDIISLGWLLEPRWLKFLSQTIFKTLAKVKNIKKQIEEAKKEGVKVLAGISNDPKDIFYFDGLGVDGIVTDEPLVACLLNNRPNCF